VHFIAVNADRGTFSQWLLMNVLGLLVTSQNNWTRWPWVSCPGCCGREHRRKI